MDSTPKLHPPAHTLPLKDPGAKTISLGTILRFLTEPTVSIRESGQRRRARLLSALLATQFLVALLSTVQVLSTSHKPSDIYTSIGATLMLLAAYCLSRTHLYNLATLLTVGIVSGAIFIGEAFSPAPPPLYFLNLGVLVSSLFLPRRATFLIMAINIIGIWLLWSFFPILPIGDVIGSTFAVLFIGMLGIVGTTIYQQDLEEIQDQSISLRESEDRFRLVAYATNDVVWDWDLLTGQIWRNQNAQRLFGFREDQMTPIIDWWEMHIHPDEQEKIIRSLREAIDSGETFWSNEYRFQRADGSYIYVFDRAYITHDEKSRQPLRVLGAIMDITARKQAEEILRQEALYDPLTGLFNRRYMEEMLEREISRAARNAQPISIIMLDIDRFKQVNDTLGHAAGDSLLHTLGILLLQNLRESDIACRYGGDEFILILPGAPLTIAQQRAEKICMEARELVIEPYADMTKMFSLSLGVAVFPQQGSTREAIFAAADNALYHAKKAGRNQVFVTKE